VFPLRESPNPQKQSDLFHLRPLHLLSSIVSSLNGLFPCYTTMLDMPHDTLALVPQHLKRLILPKIVDLATSVHTDGVLC